MSLAGGLQPLVTPVVPSLSMSPSKMEALRSGASQSESAKRTIRTGRDAVSSAAGVRAEQGEAGRRRRRSPMLAAPFGG